MRQVKLDVGNRVANHSGSFIVGFGQPAEQVSGIYGFFALCPAVDCMALELEHARRELGAHATYSLQAPTPIQCRVRRTRVSPKLVLHSGCAGRHQEESWLHAVNCGFRLAASKMEDLRGLTTTHGHLVAQPARFAVTSYRSGVPLLRRSKV